jgi:hypothetical protein
MCFSTEASFGVGIVLSAIGVATLKKAKQPSEIFFASIPLIFAVQQIDEGFLWLALSNRAYAAFEVPATYVFLIIAQIIWPIWVPFSILKLETTLKRQKIISIFLGMGGLVALYNSFCFLNYQVKGNIVDHHIAYFQDYTTIFSNYIRLFYVLATIFPPFFSSIKRMWALSTAIFISSVITTIFYEDYFVSVWCFFASIISITVYVAMREISKAFQTETKMQTSNN